MEIIIVSYSEHVNNKNIQSSLFTLNKTFNFIKIYTSLKKEKINIFRDHKIKQGGVYLLFNKINNHFYIGSTISIKGRMKNYLNPSFLKLKKNYSMPISKALLKYDYDSFSLVIIEYLVDSKLEERETFWIKKLKPYYNILQVGYHSLGYKHTMQTKYKLRNLALGRLHLESTKLMISQMLKGDKNPFYNQKHSLKSKDLISIKKSHGLVYIYDSLYNFQGVFKSLTELAKIIKANNNSLNLVLNKDRLFRGNWYIRNQLLFKENLPIIKDKYYLMDSELINDMIKAAHIKQAIYVFNNKNKEFLRKYDGIILAEKELEIRHEKIKDSIIKKKPIGNYIFSYHRLLERPNK